MSRAVQRSYAIGKNARDVRAQEMSDGVRIHVGDVVLDLRAQVVRRIEGGVELSIEREGHRVRAFVARDGDVVHVAIGGRTHRIDVRQQSGAAAAGGGGADDEPFALSPMTGVVLKVDVATGDTVAAGASMLVVEAMKMEFVVEAPRDVVVQEMLVAVGDRVDIGQRLVTFVADVRPADEAGAAAPDEQSS